MRWRVHPSRFFAENCQNRRVRPPPIPIPILNSPNGIRRNWNLCLNAKSPRHRLHNKNFLQQRYGEDSKLHGCTQEDGVGCRNSRPRTASEERESHPRPPAYVLQVCRQFRERIAVGGDKHRTRPPLPAAARRHPVPVSLLRKKTIFFAPTSLNRLFWPSHSRKYRRVQDNYLKIFALTIRAVF